MAQSELSLIRFGVLNFFHLIMTSQPFSPVTTKLLKIVEALIQSEPEQNPVTKSRIDYIREFTHEKINMHISIIEYVVFNNLEKSRNFSREIEIKSKSYNLIFLYRVLDEISSELTRIVVEIAKKYSVDIPILNNYGKQTTTIEI